MARQIISQHTHVKVYHGYGHKHNLTIYGHVYEKKSEAGRNYHNNILSNIIYLVSLFLIKPVAGAKVQLVWRSQILNGISEKDGFYKFEWESDDDVAAGWHTVTVHLLDEAGNIAKSGAGKVFVPHLTQFGFISDIDDTVMISYSASIFKRLSVLFTRNPRSRSAFDNVGRHYKLLSEAHTTALVPNPFFYVSSSEWNLYDDLNEFFRFNALPEGTFLLSQVKRWYQLLRTGKTMHEGKLLRVSRVLNAFPLQQFILIGDNSQADPYIYEMICEKHPEKIFAVYIRSVIEKKVPATKELLSNIEKSGIFTCLFTNNEEAIIHSKKIGLIN
ncbi:MAG: phosphatase domain-containing protein [Ferruginibacter sp.]